MYGVVAIASAAVLLRAYYIALFPRDHDLPAPGD